MKKKGGKIKITAIIPSAGKGTRFKSNKRKPLTNLNRQPLLSYALKAFQSSTLIEEVILVIDKSLLTAAKKLVERYKITKVKHIVKGGKTRTESVRKGLCWVDKDTSLVLIHDGVRPFVSGEVIKRTIDAALKFGASVSAVPVKATIKISKKNSFVKYTPDRAKLWEVQTPQVFKKELIEDAYRKIKRNKMFTPPDRRSSRNRRRRRTRSFTDDAALVENAGKKVKIVRGDYNNIKITTTEDIKIAEALLRRR